MTPFLTIVALGFLLGMRHATDPDHVVAVATIVSRQRSLRAAAPIGLAWGIGHTATVFAVGVAIIAFGVVIPPRVGLGLEFLVSLMLVVLGAAGLVTACSTSAKHQHGILQRMDRFVDRWRGYRLARPLLVGLVHGLAGSAAIALLVLGTIQGVGAGLAYLVVFGVGTLAGMSLVTLGMAMPVALSAARFGRIHRWIALASSVVSLVFGGYLVYEIGYVHGLFSASPSWTPE